MDNIYLKAFELNPDPVFIIDNNKNIKMVNNKFCKLTGYKKKEILKYSLDDNIPFIQKDEMKLMKCFKSLKSKKEIFECNFTIISKDKEKIKLEMRASPLIRDDKLLGVIVVARDIRDQIKTKNILEDKINQLERQKAYTQQLFDESEDGIALLDNNNIIRKVNKSFTKIFGYSQREIKGLNIDQLITPKNRLEEGKELSNKVIKGTRIKKEVIRKTKDNKKIYVSLHGIPIKTEENQIGIYAVYRDITKRKNEEKKIQQLSFHDQLTGLYNRRYFEDTIKRLNNSRKLPIGIITADINNLKEINDLYGHSTGDQYIKKVAKIIKSSVRCEDIVARVGGDEFTIILPETNEKEIEVIEKRIQKRFNNTDLKGNLLKVSTGCAVKTQREDKLKKTVKRSDDNMYKMKQRTKEDNLKRKLSIVKNRQRVVFNESPIAICISDFHSNFVDINKKYCELVGYNLKELKDMTYLDITKEEDKYKNKKYAEAMKNKEIEYFEFEKRYIRKDGTEIDVELKVKLIKDFKGEPVFTIAFVEEI